MRSLSLKLILAFLVVSIAGTALVATLTVLSTASLFNRFVANQLQDDIVSRLREYYQNNRSWSDFSDDVPRLVLLNPVSARPPVQGLSQGQSAAAQLLLVDNGRRAVISGLGYQHGEMVSAADWRRGEPIVVDGRQVGRLITSPDFFRRGLIGAELRFLNRIKNTVIIGTVGATAVAVTIGIFLARTLTKPLKELTKATEAVAQGDLAQQVPIRSQDELGQLAAAFNRMNTELARSREHQRQMTADIAHDLRTPLSVVLGHAEALNDGVLPPSQETFQTIYEEARRLNRLIDDLRTLSLAEAGELPLIKRWVNPEILLARASRAHEPQAERKDITLVVESEKDLPDLYVDPDRFALVMDNLLDNSLRYTPEGGVVALKACRDPGSEPAKIRLEVQNDGPEIDPEELPYIFQRFYRNDKSRQRREEGGSGLGLSIARSIVESHSGKIWAESETGEGVRFVILLPTQE